MNRTLKYTLWFGRTSLCLTVLALIDVFGIDENALYCSLSLLISLPGYHLTDYSIGDPNWSFHDTLPQGITIILAFNTIFCAAMGMLVALASPPLNRQHRKRIKRFGIKTAIAAAVLTVVSYALYLAFDNVLEVFPVLVHIIRPFIWLGSMQAYYIWEHQNEIYIYGMFIGIAFNSLLGFGLGCLIAAFTARWAKFPTKNGCPKCDYDLTGTPEHCPECGWEKDVNTP